jgi:hemoglobin-like flavoprotein
MLAGNEIIILLGEGVLNFEDVFDESYERVLQERRSGQGFFESFYQRFLQSSPEIAAHFQNTDMNRQQKMLKKSFYGLFVFYASGHADDYIVKVAESHSRAKLDIKPELYDVWLDSLMETVKQFDSEFSDEIELAWRLVLTPGITYMKFKYDRPGAE